MKILDGAELASFIKQRQAKQVRSLRQAHSIVPCLAIVQTVDDPVIETYVRLKQEYGADIEVEVQVHRVEPEQVKSTIEKLNTDDAVQGIIVQLPLASGLDIDDTLESVAPHKDVDGLNSKSDFDAATPQAILWLIDGYNLALEGKHIALVGKGRLVGGPLLKRLQERGLDTSVYEDDVADLGAVLAQAEVIISATGVAGLIKSEMSAPNTVLIDAGVAVEGTKTMGDVANDVYERSDLTITPKKGGVGPLTVCALFENVLLASSRQAPTTSS